MIQRYVRRKNLSVSIEIQTQKNEDTYDISQNFENSGDNNQLLNEINNDEEDVLNKEENVSDNEKIDELISPIKTRGRKVKYEFTTPLKNTIINK